MRVNDSRHILRTSAVIALILAVAGLFLIASHSRYLPKSDPAHIITSIAKMNVAPPIIFAPPPSYALTRIAPAQTNLWTVSLGEFETFELRQIGLTVSLQHRSPPSFLA